MRSYFLIIYLAVLLHTSITNASIIQQTVVVEGSISDANTGVEVGQSGNQEVLFLGFDSSYGTLTRVDLNVQSRLNFRNEAVGFYEIPTSSPFYETTFLQYLEFSQGGSETLIDNVGVTECNGTNLCVVDLEGELNFLPTDFVGFNVLYGEPDILFLDTYYSMVLETSAFGRFLSYPEPDAISINEMDVTWLSEFTLTYVYDAVVPVPAAIWLFTSGLIGLIGLARRKY